MDVASRDPPAVPVARTGWTTWYFRIHRWLTQPEYRRLRWVLGIGLLVRLILAPLTSWSVDTPGSVVAGVSALYYGNPYVGTTWFNPPLGPFLAAPFIAVPSLLYGPQGLIQVVSAIAPMTVATGVNAVSVPIPAALLAWKLPLIGADVLGAVALYALGGTLAPYSRLPPATLAAAWFLNPLVIWASAVHGEVDSLAAACVLVFLWSSVQGRWAPAGLFLGLAIFAKGYPLVLLPLAITAVLAWPGAGGRRWQTRFVDLGWWAVGIGTSLLAFFEFIPQTLAVLTEKGGHPTYGGITVLSVFNAASPKGASGWYFQFATNLSEAGNLLLLFRVLASLGIAAGVALLAYHLRYDAPSDSGRLRVFSLAALLAVTGLLLADPDPEPENVIAVLPLLLLTLTYGRPNWGWWAYWLLSLSGIALYWAFLTPAAMFYPLANLLGTPAVDWVNGVAIGYVRVASLSGSIWLAAGLVGGASLIAIWARAGYRLMSSSTWKKIRGVWRIREAVVGRPPL